jgi:alkanesulfonate monooxygenase SsuD/methylene tetrahydromethanopterin reductase-like flavin-dependent oxidoreductase (luciferase family)
MNQYRQSAAECYEAARILSGHREKAEMLAIAQSWILLAALAERTSHLDATTGLTGRGNRPGLTPYSRHAKAS